MMCSPSASPIPLQVRETTGLLRGTTSKRSKKQVLTSRWKYLASAGTTLLCFGAFVHYQHHVQSNSTTTTASPVVVQEEVAKEMINLSKSSRLGDYEDFFTNMQAMIDEDAKPCEDFYQYACGRWLEDNDIPGDRSSTDSSFYVVAERNKEIIQQVIDEKPPVITEFYTSCLNNQEVDQESVAYIADLMHHIQKLNTTEQLISYAGELDESLGVDSFFSLQALADPKDPSVNVMTLSQGGLTLPSKEYYFEKQKIAKYGSLFLEYVTDLFAIDDLDHYNVSAYAADILEIETALANISLSNAELRDPWSTNKPFPLEEIEEKYLPLHNYLEGVRKRQKFTRKYHAIVTTPSYFEGLTQLLMRELPIQQLKNYLSFHVIDSFSTILGEYFRRVSHKFHGTISGLGRLPDRKQWCVDTTTSFLGDLLGEYYMKDVFSKDDRKAAQDLINQIEKAMKTLLKGETWLDKVTFKAALDKLKNVANLIGGPDKVEQPPVEMKADNFFDNVVALRELRAENVITRIGKRVDRKKWDMFASTVNAYYDPNTNKIVFPAAILQPPFYSAKDFPNAANYARIGMVMGHELTHGFDDQGRNYDATGRLRKWWSKLVSDDFNTKATCLADQYSKFEVYAEDGELIGNVNGRLTLGENIADNGGLKLTYDAFHMSKGTKELTSVQEDRVFFTAFAQNWCGKRSDAYAELLLSTDPHSPQKWRVNGPLINFDKFAKTFGCKAGSPMNPKDKCVIW